MAQDALEVVKLRNNFYRDSYRKLIVLLFIFVIAILGLVGGIVVLVYERPTPTYFATTDSGRIIALIPLNQPNLSDRSVLQWASTAVVSIFTYNFVNYRQAFQDNKQYFTDPGWRSFLNAVQQSKDLSTVQDKKLVVSAVLSSAPIVTNEYVLNGRYTWKLQLPVMVTYQSLSEDFHDNFVVAMTVQRVSTLDNISGVGISSFVVLSQ